MDKRRQLNKDEIKALADLLAEKYAEERLIQQEIKILKRELTDQLEFSEAKSWMGKTKLCMYKLRECLEVHPPTDVEGKRVLYTYLQKNFPVWYRTHISLDWNDLNTFANDEMQRSALSKTPWSPWPMCNVYEGLKFDMRLLPNALKKNIDPRVAEFSKKFSEKK